MNKLFEIKIQANNNRLSKICGSFLLLYVICASVLQKEPGARFSNVLVTFRARIQIFKSKYKE